MQRFWSKVDRAGHDECWPWSAGRDRDGYGRFRAGRPSLVVAYAHRVAWTLSRGPIPDGLDVLHSCDNPPCCNPQHLFLGTNADNMADKIAKGRQAAGDKSGARQHPEALARGDRNGSRTHPERVPRGEQHGQSKLTASDVIAIREELRVETPYSVIAQRFGISKATVSLISSGRIWRHLPPVGHATVDAPERAKE